MANSALLFGVSLQGKTKEGKTFLEEALYQYRLWFFKLFSNEELKSEAQKVFKNGILNEAIQNSANEIIQYLIDNHIGLEDKDKKSRTPLMNAYFYEITSLLHPLLAKTKEINQEDKDGRTALFYPVLAAQYGWLMQLFRVKGQEIQINHQDKFGETALMKAVLMNNKEIVQQLIAEGADILIKNDEGKDVFNLAMSEGNIKMANLIKTEMKKKLGLVSPPKKLVLPKKKVTNWGSNTQKTRI